MAVIISNGNTTLNTTNGFYRVETENLGCLSNTTISLTTTRYINVTFRNSGNLKGILLGLITTSMTSRQLVVSFEENVSETWTERLSKTFTPQDIAGSNNSSFRGEYFFPIIFDSTYAIDTVSSKWRFKIAHGTGTGTWVLMTSDTINPFYAAWCDTPMTFTDGDIILVKDYVTIDKTATLGSQLGTGELTAGYSGVICSNSNDPTPDNVSYLIWENEPTSSYTFTLPGRISMGTFSGFRVGTSINKIPISKKATIVCDAPTVGTLPGRFSNHSTSYSYSYGVMSSFFLYGEVPTYQYTTLSQDAAINQKVIVVDDLVDWQPGDQIVIGKQHIIGQGEVSIYTIDTVVGNTITLTSNILTYIRRSGGTVIKLGGRGIEMKYEATAASIPQYLYSPANFQIKGVDFKNIYFYNLSLSFYYYLNYINSTCRTQILVEDVCHYVNNTTGYFMSWVSPPDGMLIQRVYTFRSSPIYSTYAYYTYLHQSGRVTMKDCRILSTYQHMIPSTSENIRLSIENCVFENARSMSTGSPIVVTGVDSIYKNNKLWGIQTTYTSGGAMYIGRAINAYMENNEFNYCAYAISFRELNSITCINKNSVFGNEYNNTVDFIWNTTASNPGITFINTTGNNIVINDTYRKYMEYVGRVSFQDYQGISGNDFTYYRNGIIQRTMSGLSDGTVRTEGGSAMRLESTSVTETFDYTFDIPIGNALGESITVSIWCKINSASYYSSDYDMPSLSVFYDKSSTSSSYAQTGTDWQQLSVNFTPTTNIGVATVTLSTRTNATSSNAYVYFDDMDISYPSSYTMNLGGLDSWDTGRPLLSSMSTQPSSNLIFIKIGESLLKISDGRVIGIKRN